MNERIENLKKQCKTERCWDTKTEKWVEGSFDEDKFAKLIVNEAARAIELEVNNWQQLAPFNNIIKQRGVFAIKQHFGL